MHHRYNFYVVQQDENFDILASRIYKRHVHWREQLIKLFRLSNEKIIRNNQVTTGQILYLPIENCLDAGGYRADEVASMMARVDEYTHASSPKARLIQARGHNLFAVAAESGAFGMSAAGEGLNTIAISIKNVVQKVTDNLMSARKQPNLVNINRFMNTREEARSTLEFLGRSFIGQALFPKEFFDDHIDYDLRFLSRKERVNVLNFKAPLSRDMKLFSFESKLIEINKLAEICKTVGYIGLGLDFISGTITSIQAIMEHPNSEFAYKTTFGEAGRIAGGWVGVERGYKVMEVAGDYFAKKLSESRLVLMIGVEVSGPIGLFITVALAATGAYLGGKYGDELGKWLGEIAGSFIYRKKDLINFDQLIHEYIAEDKDVPFEPRFANPHHTRKNSLIDDDAINNSNNEAHFDKKPLIT